jgi:hypothetical protein
MGKSLFYHLFGAFAFSVFGDIPCSFGSPAARTSVVDEDYYRRYTDVTPATTTLCNNVESLCFLPVDEILFGMVHNAMSSPSVSPRACRCGV